MIKRLGAIMRKEFRHILRDWQTLIIVLAMPVVMMFFVRIRIGRDHRKRAGHYRRPLVIRRKPGGN